MQCHKSLTLPARNAAAEGRPPVLYNKPGRMRVDQRPVTFSAARGSTIGRKNTAERSEAGAVGTAMGVVDEHSARKALARD
jgi:hypothetical protein